MPSLRRALRSVRSIVAIAAVLATAAACGSDELDRAEFVRLTTDGDDGLDREVAQCVYDALSKDATVLAELSDKGPRSDELSDASDKKMQNFLAECILAGNGATDSSTTTGPPRRTTTSEASRE